MTIEEKAKEIFVAQEYTECENANDEMWMKRDAFGRGAEWMLEKACEYLMKQLPVHYPEWKALAEENVKQFKKAMDE